MLYHVLFSVFLGFIFTFSAFSETWYVNNRQGHDQNNGKEKSTAFATISKAISMAKTSDKIVLANTGKPYLESIILDHLGGTAEKPFIIDGNNAVIRGMKIIKSEQWQKIKGDLYFFPIVNSKGTSYLVNRGKKLPRRHRKAKLEKIALGEFLWNSKGVYFRCEKGKSIESYELGATFLLGGMLVRNSNYIICRNLIAENFANDGFGASGNCDGLYFENIESRYNGDEGISIHDHCGLVVRNAYVHHNINGIHDVNGSRSFYNGVVSEYNESMGVGFSGGMHSIADSTIRNNRVIQVYIDRGFTKHLVGPEFNPLCHTMVYLKNVNIEGNKNDRYGLLVGKNNTAIVEYSSIRNSKIGVKVNKGGICHLSASSIENCDITIQSDSKNFFRDYNSYNPFLAEWMGKKYSADKWEEFRKIAGHDKNSSLAPLTPPAGVKFPEAFRNVPLSKSLYLIDIKPENDPKPGWLPGGKIWKTANGKIKLVTSLRGEGQEFKKSIFAHANVEIIYKIPDGYTMFLSAAGIGAPVPNASVIFKVYVDGKEKYKSQIYRIGQPILPVVVDITGGKKLKLVVDDAGDGITNDYTWWADARFIKN